MTFWDWWRLGNSAAALLALCIAIKWMIAQWPGFINSERIRWMSFAALLFSACYGPCEIVFFPQARLRIPILTAALIWALVSLAMKPRITSEEARHAKR